MTIYSRHRVVWITFTLVSVLLAIAVLVVVAATELPANMFGIIGLMYGVVSLCATVFFVWRDCSIKRMVIRRNGFVCKYCGYDLRTTSDSRCPECGQSFNLHELPKYWQKVLRLKERPSAPASQSAHGNP